jgi:SAM-dependent methyltransferase
MTTSTQDPTTELKQAHRRMWASGDYASVAALIDEVPPARLFDAIDIAPGHDVLDVATGTGNVALRAARAGANVTGLDLVPELLAIARERADAESLVIEWIAGDAEQLPFPDAHFDRVVSVFGVQFAPRHATTAAELLRVCRPDGAIGLVNWTPEGLIGRLFKIMGSYMPPPPEFASPPPLWGDPHHLRALFGHAADVRTSRATTPFRFPSLQEYMTFFEETYGPTLQARARLAAEGRWDDCRAELAELYSSLNEANDGTLHIESEFTVAIVTPRSDRT